MKAEMDKNGVIIISPETTVEAYALSCWVKESMTTTSTSSNFSGKKFIIQTSTSEADHGQA